MADDLQSNRMRVPLDGLSDLEFHCPVDGCDWRLRESEVPAIPLRGSGPTIEDAINAIARGRAIATDQHLRKHFSSHDVVDFLKTIRRLEQELYNAGHTGVRPHVSRPVTSTEALKQRQQPDIEPGIGWP